MPERGSGITGGGVAQRLRRTQERFEPLVTRFVLGGIFVVGLIAQFVQPGRHGNLAVRCEYRFYPGIPGQKICIFNRMQVLHGFYDLSVRMRLQRTGPEYYDPKGYTTDLNVCSPGTAASDPVVTMWNKHFDDRWALASVPGWRRSAAA